ncbi:MAG: hypothetical protein ACI9EP_000407 [Oceanospirillaceae bacterium]|jgi:hypothetical protein
MRGANINDVLALSQGKNPFYMNGLTFFVRLLLCATVFTP